MLLGRTIQLLTVDQAPFLTSTTLPERFGVCPLPGPKENGEPVIPSVFRFFAASSALFTDARVIGPLIDFRIVPKMFAASQPYSLREFTPTPAAFRSDSYCLTSGMTGVNGAISEIEYTGSSPRPMAAGRL